ILPHVLHERTPRQVLLLQLIDDRRNVRRVNAAITDWLTVPCGARLHEIIELRAVYLDLGRGCDARDHRQVVAEAVMRDAMVLAKECTCHSERIRQIWRA